MRTTHKLALGLIFLALLVPLGLLLPGIFKAGPAWGEWDAGELKALAGYVPARLAEWAGRWRVPLPDYAFSGSGEGVGHLSAAYIFSALVGGGLAALAAFAFGRLLLRKKKGSDVCTKRPVH